MSALSRYTLIFADPSLEREYDSKAQARTLLQGRIAVSVGSILYLTFGILDAWYVPSELRLAVWLARLVPMSVPLAVLILMATRWFHALNYILVAMVGLSAGTALLIIFALIPIESLSVYCPAPIANYCSTEWNRPWATPPATLWCTRVSLLIWIQVNQRCSWP
jgi:hypothetical protein